MDSQIEKRNLGINSTLFQHLASVLEQMGVTLTPENINENFSHLGFDSIMMMEVVVGLEEILDKHLPLDQLSRENLATPKSLLTFIGDFMNDKTVTPN